MGNPYGSLEQGEDQSPATEEKDTPAFEQAVKRNNLEQMETD